MGQTFGLNCKLLVNRYPTAAAVDFECAQSWVLRLKMCQNRMEKMVLRLNTSKIIDEVGSI